MRSLLALFLSFTLWMNFANAQEKTFYISANGSNGNTGTTINSPLATIDTLIAGNTYLFKRGDIFYTAIKRVDNNIQQPIKISAYGNGAKPVLTALKTIKPAAWQNTGNHIWKVSLKIKDNYTGFTDNTTTNVGFIKVQNIIRGNKLTNTQSLNTNWDFCSVDDFLYIYSVMDPASLSKPIQVATNVCLLQLSNNMIVEHLRLTGTGGHAVKGSGVKNVTLSDLTISEIGGSYLKETVRYGNGIEFWGGASDCIVQNCTTDNVYDSAYTLQSYDSNTIFRNIELKNNKSTRCEQSFEFWLSGASSKFINCSFHDNYCTNAGYGWSHPVRPVKTVAVDLLCYYGDVNMSGLSINKNTFVNARSGYLYINLKGNNRINFTSNYNNITLGKQAQILSGYNGVNFLDKQSFQSTFKTESKSIFKKLKN
jgi:hypothetical protein